MTNDQSMNIWPSFQEISVACVVSNIFCLQQVNVPYTIITSYVVRPRPQICHVAFMFNH